MNDYAAFSESATEHVNVYFCTRSYASSAEVHPSPCMSSQADGCQRRMTHNFQRLISTEPHDMGDKASENVSGEKANIDLSEATSKTPLTVPQFGSDIFSPIH